MAIIMKGKPVVEEMLKGKTKRVDKVVIFTNGEDEASKVYVRNKKKKFEEFGIECETISTNNLSLGNVSYKVNELIKNKIPYMFQLPLANEGFSAFCKNIPFDLDLDTMGNFKQGAFYAYPGLLNTPCTPLGIYNMLKFYIPKEKLYNKNVVVIGRSLIVGRPIARLMEYVFDSTVTICHSKTQNLEFYTKNADIIIIAIGKPKFLKASIIKEGAILVDVGINKGEDGKIYGDVDFEACKGKCYAITPVPGGVGVTTVGSLVLKCLKSKGGNENDF